MVSAFASGPSDLGSRGRFMSNRLLLAFTGSCQSTVRVRAGPGKPGKSINFIMEFSRTGKFRKKATGPGKFWKSVKLN